MIITLIRVANYFLHKIFELILRQLRQSEYECSKIGYI